jgi:GNAT superfamily N-acetyltransferase
MDRETSQRLNVNALREFYSRIGENAPDAQLIVRDGLIATINPGAPKASLFNSVIYDDPAAVERELAELAALYDEAEVLAWTVWIPDDDEATAALTESAGHKLDSVPRMMGAELDRLDFGGHSMDEIEWTAAGSPDVVNEINDFAYGMSPGLCERGFGRLDPESFYLYVADYEGEPGACAVTFDVGEDCNVWAVATLPEARNRGLSTKLMRQALLDARDRGMKTTTLQASKLGKPVYDKVGYEDHGHFQMWERRREQ